MVLVESIVGNINDPVWKQQLEGATLDYLNLDQWQAQKNRFRLNSDGGAELAISLDRNSHLHNGDILVWDAATRNAVVAHIQLQEVLVIQYSGLLAQAQEALAQTCFELGHALGNQHWPAVVKGTRIFVPLTVDRKVMASVMKTHAFTGITYEFLPGTEVIPFLAPHESRRLFGGANATPHSHTHEHAHDHDHGHGHGHHHHHY
jgi:urease accessory protein